MKVFKTSTYRRHALRLYLLTAVLITALLSSCISDSNFEMPEHESEITVSLRILPQSHETRSATRPIPNGEEVLFHTGDLYLVNGEGRIVQHFRIVGGSDAYELPGFCENLGMYIIGRNLLEACDDPENWDDPLCGGVLLEGVPGTVQRVVIHGNTPVTNGTLGSHLGSSVSGSMVGAHLIDVVTQNDPWNVNLFGESLLRSEITPRTLGQRTVIPFDITINPTVARFEIGHIVGDGAIQSFTVAGIFMDNYHAQAQANGRGFSVNRINHGERPGRFLEGTYFFANRRGGQHHWRSASDDWTGNASNSRTATPGGATEPDFNNVHRANVWGFQLFAAERVLPPAIPTIVAPPTIVIRLSEVVVSDGMGGTETLVNQFITVNAFYFINESTSAAETLAGIIAGNVYRIHEIKFNEFDLRDVPNRHFIGVRVSIGLCVWCGNNVLQRYPLRQPNPVAITCPGFPLTINLAAAVAPPGTITYRWERSADGTSGWTQIATGQNLTGVVVPIGEYVRRVAVWNSREFPTLPAKVTRPILSRERHRNDLSWVEIAGTRWATHNVYTPGIFVEYSGDAGPLYQWRRNIAWSLTNPLQQWTGTAWVNATWDSSLPVGLDHWLNTPCPAGWRLPTEAEALALINYGQRRALTSAQAFAEGHSCWEGALFGTEPNLLFLPAARRRNTDGTLEGVQQYWTSTTTGATHAIRLMLPSGAGGVGGVNTRGRAYGANLRCVQI